jgi:hypothetical protein
MFRTFVLLLITAVCSIPVSSLKLPTIKFVNKVMARTATAFTVASFTLNPVLPQNANAFGPVEVTLKINSYKQVDLCNGKKPIMPGQKAAEGLFPICVEVEAVVVNPDKAKTLTDVSVYGFVKENTAGNSVLPNNPDFKSDSGQYAMIKSVPPGESTQTYQFVAAVTTDPKKEPLPPLTFFKTKAVSFPGGEKFKPLSDCEIDPRSCNDDEEED